MPAPDNSPFDMPEMPPGLEGNLYPRDGAEWSESDQYFDEPEERKEDEREQANEAAATIPFLKQIHEWFDEEIAKADSIDNIKLQSINIGGAVIDPKVGIEAQLLAHQLVKQILQEKKASFPDLEVES